MDRKIYLNGTTEEYQNAIRTVLRECVSILAYGDDEMGSYILIRPYSAEMNRALQVLSDCDVFYMK